MKEQLIKLLSDFKGRGITLTTGAVAAVITKILSRYNLQLDAELETLIAALVGLGVTWLIDVVILQINSAGIKQIQAPLPGIEEDGYAGNKTIAAVEKAVDQSNQ